MNAKLEFVSPRSLLSDAAEAGFYELPPALQDGLIDMLVGAIEGTKAYLEESSEIGLDYRRRSRDIELLLIQAKNYCIDAACAIQGNRVSCAALHLDRNGVENWKHAAARFALACCVRRLVAEESEGSK